VAEKREFVPARLDLGRIIKAALWFFFVGLVIKLFTALDPSWWIITAPLWSSFFFTVFTKRYNPDGTERK
jgi:hypothetical protein